MPLDLEPIRERCAALDLKSWWEIVETVTCEEFAEVGVFVQHAPDDIAALLAEVEMLREEVAILTGPMLCDECDALISLGEE